MRAKVRSSADTGRRCSRAAPALVGARGVGRLSGRRAALLRTAPAVRVEVLDAEGRIAGPLAGASPRRREGLRAGRVDAEESLRWRRAVEPLVRPEHDVMCECEFEPSLQVLDGKGTVEAEARGVLEGSPERSRRAVAWMFRAEAKRCRTPSRPTAFAKSRPRNSPPRSVVRYFGAPKTRAVAVRSRTILAASGFVSPTCSARGTREKASKTPATWRPRRPCPAAGSGWAA